MHRPGRRERLEAAAQVLALVALLQELELHVGAAAIRNMRLVRNAAGVRAVLRTWPRSLDGLAHRLGGTERAVRGNRDGILEALRDTLGIALSPREGAGRVEWLTFEPWLERVLGELPRPLPYWVARSLWVLRLDPLPVPREGETAYWSVATEETAHRLAAALATELASGGVSVHWYEGGIPESSTAPLPPVGGPGAVLVLSGALGVPDLLAVERWVQQGRGRRSVAVGRFPGGWSPPEPPPARDGGVQHRLLVTGIPRERARLEEERWGGRFGAAGRGAGESLTRSASWLFQAGATGAPGGTSGSTELLRRCLGLDPDGVPEGFLSARTGLAGEPLSTRLRELGAEFHGGRWRWPDPRPMVRDPLHLSLARILPDDSPRKWLHEELGGRRRPELLGWARERLRCLEPGEVRSLLAPADPSGLPGELVACLVEAALTDLDVGAARPLLELLPPEVAPHYRAWLAAADGPAAEVERLVPELDPAAAPAAAGEAALRLLERSVRRGTGEAARWAARVRSAAELAGGPAGVRLRLDAAVLLDPGLVDDRAWRREALGGPDRLRLVLLRRVANLWSEAGRLGAARRLFLRTLEAEQRPGFRGLTELDLGFLALEGGRRVEADAHHLRALRLLGAAGFRRRTRAPAFNLGVTELDRLRVDRALAWFEEGSEEDWDPFLEAEMARLELARGHEEAFLDRLGALKAKVAVEDRGLAEPVAFLEGVAALLRHDLSGARPLLRSGGSEGRTWLALADALEGRDGVAPGEDGWGVVLAARCVRAVRVGRPAEAARLFAGRAPDLRDGLALALCERLLGRQRWLEASLRREAASRLREGGLPGWARLLRSEGGGGGAVAGLVTRILEGGTVPAADSGDWGPALEELGLGGLEVRSPLGGEPLLRVGGGEAAEEILEGPTVIVPLGGRPAVESAWRLLGVVLSLMVPDRGTAADPEVAATGLVGRSPESRKLRAELRRLAPSTVPVVLVGETGVGKEVAARALHALSGRRGPFVPVNMAALPPQLVEAELFGSVRGAFTGAERSRKGLVAAADGGTLFLDEIGEMDMALQAKLLRFLESSEVRPVGSESARRVDVRVVSATNIDLERAMEEGRFRSDLYFRIATAMVRIPPLRERTGDIKDLVEHFTAAAAARQGLHPVRWSPEALEVLYRHPWPGNARELRNVVEIALIGAGGGVVGPRHLPLAGSGPMKAAAGGGEGELSWDEAHRRLRRRLLEEALHRNGGNRSAAARELGISRQTLLYHMRSLGVR